MINLKNITVSIFMLSSISLIAQKNKSGSATQSRYTPRFSFEPAKRETVASSDLSIALLKPIFIDKDIAMAGTPWSDFSIGMQNDLEGLITAKGIKVRGPFNTRDEMVFNDKQQSDFTLLISIDLQMNDQREWKSVFSLVGPASIKVKSGIVTMTPVVLITAISNFSGEKLSKKTLPLPQKSFTYAGSVKWDAAPTPLRESELDNNLFNPLGKNLEDIYKEAMQILWNQFDVNEMKMIANEAKKERGLDSKTKG